MNEPGVTTPPYRVDQYVYFYVVSSRVSAEEMTRRIGLEPDRVSVMGSRRAEPAVPMEHSWMIECREPIPVDEQIRLVLARVREATVALGVMVEAQDVHCGLMMVRYFGDEDGAPGPGQLGWVLDPEDVQFLASLGASIQADEYTSWPGA